jgi:AcrR family transcriptional regulator
MSPRTKKQFADIRKEKRELILETALEVFATHGYHGASISTIANHAGIAKGLIYNYFESKEELIKEIINSGFVEIEKIFDPDKDGVLTAEEFEYFISEYIYLLRNNISYWKLYYSLMFQPSVVEFMRNQKIGDLFTNMFERLTQYLIKCGFKHPNIEMQLLHCMFDGITYNYLLLPDDFPLDEIKEYLIDKYSRPFQKK